MQTAKPQGTDADTTDGIDLVESVKFDSECAAGLPAERQLEITHTTEPPEDPMDLEKQENDGACTGDLDKPKLHMQKKGSMTEIGQGSMTEDTSVPVRVFRVSITVRVGGVVLALCAGMVNAISFLALSAFVSHMTGSATKLGLGLEGSKDFDPNECAMLVVSFVLGAALTGFLIAKDTIHFGMALYDLCLLSESGLLIATTFCYNQPIAKFLAAAACGLQNGMATHWGGAVIRTTHVTGLLTDVGLLLGRLTSLFCRKRCTALFDSFDRVVLEDDLSKLSVLLMIFAGFVTGVFCGAHLHNAFDYMAFLAPASITGGIGLLYSMYRVIVLGQSFFSDAEMEAIDINTGADLVEKSRPLKRLSPEDEDAPRKIASNPSIVSSHTAVSGHTSVSAHTAHSHETISAHSAGDVVCITRKEARARIEPNPSGDAAVKLWTLV